MMNFFQQFRDIIIFHLFFNIKNWQLNNSDGNEIEKKKEGENKI